MPQDKPDLFDDMSIIITLDHQEQVKALRLAAVCMEEADEVAEFLYDQTCPTVLVTLGLHTALLQAYETVFPSRYEEAVFENDE